ncbi:hypothetical protein ES705_22469 [subsurface metagenome]
MCHVESYEKFISSVEKELRKPLPGISAQYKMAPDGRIERVAMARINSEQQISAVLILIFPEHEIPLPLISVYNSTYFEHDFYFKLTRGHLLIQLGFDVYYNTPYNAMAYMPSTGQFYIQDQKELGNYPYIVAFLNFKLKRTRFFFMFDHVNSGFTGNNYFSVLHYPLNQRTFKFGLSWTFYD